MLKLNIVNNLTATDIDSLEERAKEMNAQMMNNKMLENKKSFKIVTIVIVLLCIWSYLFANSLGSDEEFLNFIYSGSTVLCLIMLGFNIVSYFEDSRKIRELYSCNDIFEIATLRRYLSIANSTELHLDYIDGEDVHLVTNESEFTEHISKIFIDDSCNNDIIFDELGISLRLKANI